MSNLFRRALTHANHFTGQDNSNRKTGKLNADSRSADMGNANVGNVHPVNVSLGSTGTAMAGSDSFPIPKFWEPNYWEPSVQLALCDYCRPGDIVYDVGANAGALSMIMSRHVGPRGIVCAFEASPRIIDKTHYNLVQSGGVNVYLYFCAVYHTSRQVVTLYPGRHLNDSIYNNYGTEGGAKFEVQTLALDDFVAASGLTPKLIKMDIEGAEYDALKGAANIVSKGKPILILELFPPDMRCHELLVAAGYIAIDLANYRRINSADDFDAEVNVANILFVHQDNASDDPYVNAGTPVEVVNLPSSLFVTQPNGDLALATQIELPPGRYVCKANFTANGQENEIFAGIDSDRGRILRYHAYTQRIACNHRDWVFSLPVTSTITPYIQFIRGEDASFCWHGATIYRFAAFDNGTSAVVH